MTSKLLCKIVYRAVWYFLNDIEWEIKKFNQFSMDLTYERPHQHHNKNEYRNRSTNYTKK